MAIPTWQPGRLYQPGDIVLPITMPAPTAAQVENGDFSAGNVNWDYTGGAQYSATGGYGNRGPCVLMPGSVPEGLALNKSILVLPQNASTFEASAMIQQGASIAGATRGWVEVRWFDAESLLLDSQRGNIVSDGSGGAWHKSTVTATRPAGAAYARAGIGLFSVADHSHEIFGDNLTVSGTFAGLPDGLVYKAVQAESGFSANTEPKWPPILGQTVVDNDVTWEAVASTRVTWEASPLYVSGTTEPEWPTDIGGYVRDGTIDWKAVSRRVEDANCPDSNIVAIAASKVFAGDDDIVRYSATVNPLDWTTADDAGYLPTGLQNYGSNPVAAMGLYRGNLAVFNAEGFQLWQVDEDPASMALIDALPLGSTEHRSVAPVANDLLFATSLGIRSLGVSASSTNYQAGDVGAPIDTLVKDALRVAKQNGSKVLATYYPGAGQYSLSFSNYPPPPPSLFGSIPNGYVGSRGIGRYVRSGGVAPYGPVYLKSGSLPPGVTLSSDGSFTYDFLVEGSYSWQVAFVDADGTEAVLSDQSAVSDGVAWLSAGKGFPDRILLGKFKTNQWAPVSTGGIAAGKTWNLGGTLHLSDQGNPFYSYSKDGGASWAQASGASSITTGGGALAFKDGMIFACGGVSPMQRRLLPDGAWQVPVNDSSSRAQDVVAVGNELVAVSQYASRSSASTNNGASWIQRGIFQASTATSPRLATNGSRLVVVSQNSNGYQIEIKYSDDKGATWVQSPFLFPNAGQSNQPLSILYDGEFWIASTSSGQIARSVDGETWVLTATSGVRAVQMAYGGGMVMAACGTAGYMYSMDHGATWSPRALPSGFSEVTGIAWVGENQ